MIAQPDIEILEGQDSGPVTFEAVVEVRPILDIQGYTDLVIEVSDLSVTQEEIDESVNRLLEQAAERNEVDDQQQLEILLRWIW